MENNTGKVRVGAFACAGAALFALVAATAAASQVEWQFPRMGSCHEGLAFGNGKTGVLVWGGDSEIRLTVGRSDLWDHRGGYPWTPEQSYANIVAAVNSGDKNRLLSLFKKVTPPGEPRNPCMLPLGRVVVKVPGKTLKQGRLDPFTGLGELEFSDGGKVSLAMSKQGGGTFAMKFPEGVEFEVKTVPATDFPVYEKELKKIGFAKAAVFDDAVGPAGRRLFDTRYDNIADVSITSAGTAKHSDAHKLFCTGVVSYLHK